MRMAKWLGSYRKTHLFTGAPIGEDKCFAPGNELKSFPFGGLRLGLSICYDLRFPEVYRTLAIEEEANVFILSSAWPFPRVEHFRILATARAIENQSYMIVSNRVGTDDGVTCLRILSDHRSLWCDHRVCLDRSRRACPG